ncbi:MAG: dihydrolipoamide acetyltransferase family protein [Actinomycetota bacterium]
MPTEVVMPALGVAQETGKLLRWLKAEGDSVAAGEPLMEIETDKVTVEIEAPAAGVLGGIRAAEGDDVPVGEVVAAILAEGEALPTPAERGAPPALARGDAPASPAEGEAPSPAASESRVPATGRAPTAGGDGEVSPRTPGRVPSSPLARRRARERRIDVASVTGSGPGGAVVVSDVLATDAPAASPTAAAAGTEAMPRSAVWEVMARRTTQSWTSAPHFYLFRDVDAERLVAWRASLEGRGEGEVTLTDLLVKIAAESLRRHPEANARWEDPDVVLVPDVNVGLAVAVDDGLVVPVIAGADRLGVGQIAERRRELVAQAREGSLQLEDVRDGTFTLSNLGMYGVDAFAAVINPPQAAILAIGRVTERVVPVEGRPAIRRGMTLGLSCDHRALDGARAARFLNTVASLIEEPLGLLPP